MTRKKEIVLQSLCSKWEREIIKRTHSAKQDQQKVKRSTFSVGSPDDVLKIITDKKPTDNGHKSNQEGHDGPKSLT